MNRKRASRIASIVVSILAAIASITAMSLLVAQRIGFAREIIFGIFGSILGALIGLLLSYLWKRRAQPKEIAKIFISHSAKDKDFVKKLTDDLRRDGYIVLLPEEIVNIGDTISSKIEGVLGRADFLIAVISEDTLKSKWVQTELKNALERNLRVFPVTLGDVEVPSMLEDIMFVKVGESYSDAYRILERSIRNALPKSLKTSANISC